jgi:hypothetical protein
MEFFLLLLLLCLHGQTLQHGTYVLRNFNYITCMSSDHLAIDPD